MFLVPVVSRLAKRYNLIDHPGPRKIHQKPVPRIGGVVFVISTLALIIPVFFLDNNIGKSFRESQTQFITLLAGAVFLFLVGFIDDIKPLRARNKLFCIIAAALAICLSGARLHSVSVGGWFEIQMGWMSWPLTVLWIVVVTACINIIDGLDGLAAGIAIIVCGTIVILALWTGQIATSILMLALLGGLTGFLFFNFYPAKIFMGDSGSMFLGFMIGASSIICNMKTFTLVGLALPFLVLGIPILDTSVAVIRRSVVERRSIFAADRNHTHHRLLELGLHHRTVVIVICAVTAINASIGVFMLTADGARSMWLLLLGLCLLFVMFTCLHARRFHKILKSLKRNLSIAHKVRKEKHQFENIIIKMRESHSFRTWWETICVMAEQMCFESIDLWNRSNGQYVRKCGWDASEEMDNTNETVQFILPLRGSGNRTAEWEIRACIRVDSNLELSGQQAMLLARLMDEFPPPQQ